MLFEERLKSPSTYLCISPVFMMPTERRVVAIIRRFISDQR